MTGSLSVFKTITTSSMVQYQDQQSENQTRQFNSSSINYNNKNTASNKSKGTSNYSHKAHFIPITYSKPSFEHSEDSTTLSPSSTSSRTSGSNKNNSNFPGIRFWSADAEVEHIMMNDTTNVDFHIDVSDQNHQHQHQDAHSQEEMTQEIIMGQQQQQNQKQQSSQTSTPKGTLQSSEEYQRWKGGWRKVIKKTDAAVALTPLMSNGENGGRKQINASSAITSSNDSNQQQQQHYDGQWQTMTHQEQYQQQQEDDTEDEDEGVFITTANNNNKNIVPGETSFLSEISTSVSPSRRYHHDLNHIGMHSMNAVGSHSPGGRSGVSSSVANHPGLRFHPTGSCASTDDDDDDVDYNNEGDERVVKMLRCATAAAAAEISTPASSRRNVKEKKQQSQSSPQSIMEDGTTLTSFSDARLESKWSSKKKMGRNKSSSAATADTSCATSVMTGEDEDDYSNYSFVRNRIHVGKISSDKRVGINSNREDEEEADVNTRKSNVVGNLLIAPLKVFHEFIIENGCCSSGGKELIEKTCNGNSGNVDDDVYSHHTHDGGYDSEHGEEISFEYDDEMTEGGDDDGNGSFVLSRRHRNHRGRTESISEASSSLHYTTDDDSLSRASSKSSRSYKKQGHKKYSTVNTKVAATKAVVVSREERRSRRGRSLTARQGYNSGNEKHRYLSHSKDAISSSCSYHSDSDRIVGSRRKVKTHNKIQDDDDESINELINDAMGSDDDSAGSTGQESSHQSVAESALSQDHSTWMEMLDVSLSRSPQRTDNNIHRRPKSVKKEDPIVDVKASVAAPVVNRSPSLVDTFFKKLLSVGIQLHLIDPPSTYNSSACQKRRGKMFIRFGSRSKGIFEDPCFIWKDADGRVSSFAPKKSFTATERIGLFDVLSIKKPTMIELDGYPLAIPENCFILLMNNGASLLFEAIDNFQMTRISTAIRGIVAKMARNFVTGDNAWVTQMLTSVDKNVSDDDIVVSVAMTDVTDQLIKKSIMQQAQDRLRKKRSSR